MKKININIFSATPRTVGKSDLIAKWIYKELLKSEEIKVELIKIKDYNLSDDPFQKNLEFSEIVKNTDGFILVVPEYNHSFPAILKKMLDHDFINFNNKAVACVGVSSGLNGGARAIESLLPLFRTLKLYTVRTDLLIREVDAFFDLKGNLSNPKYQEYLQKTLQDLLWLTKVLKLGREGNN